ncbi:sulfatase-like hydrolase/transferase [Pullulanibacillus sp. KACC 23026]|uniref:sulfatase family protein n=1 Tax=Pullulanibacillus sp. KACC 23026 TaxID=3028315 RepID=UPI0023B0842F|nr:sulfatase-like hydrolase/transferase [Pullulanibacillus sp. KACC 23026]WEG10961.1 sulfatase-like hydrolase/transferase [Pullulanibacillus sp. KACC 23026]
MEQTPNILFITTDQQHWNTIRALGAEKINTPNLDRLVKEGVAFERAYVTNPTCSPSRSSIITGKYPSRHGCWNIGVALDQSHPSIGEILSENGFHTGLFGKAHFQPVLKEGSFEGKPNIHHREFWKKWDGPYYGFEKVAMVHGHADEDSSHGMHYGVWLEEQGIDPSQYFGPNGGHREGSWDLPEKFHYTRWTADRTMEFIESTVGEGDGKPFFAWCSFQDPHNAFLCPEPWNSMYNPEDLPPFNELEGEMEDKPKIHNYLIEDRMDELDVKAMADPGHDTGGIQCLGHTNKKIGYDRARKWLASYYAMISLIDHHIGRILDKLDQLHLSENTLVIFTSDHGDYAGNHGLWLKGPIHYEDILRVPFLVRWKNRIPSGIRTDSLLSLVDLAPTLLDICGIEPVTAMQGITQKETFLNPGKASRGWCLVENRAEPHFYVKTLVKDQYKLNYFLSRQEGELYDLKEDPYEYVNLYNKPEYAELRTKMFMELIDIYGNLENPYPVRESFA